MNGPIGRRGDPDYHYESDDTTGRDQATAAAPVSVWEG